MKITLLTLPPSGNIFKRMHWAAVRDLRARFAWTFRMEADLCGKRPRLPQYIGKVRLGIKVYRKGRRYDEDGFIGGLKPMIDGIRDAGYLRNDSLVWMELEPRPEQLKCVDRNERVEIEYTEIAPATREGRDKEKIMSEKKGREKEGAKMTVVKGGAKPIAKAPVTAPIPFEKQRPLFGEMDRIVNVLELELQSVQGEIGNCLRTIARKKEEADALKDRASTIQSALVDSKKFGKISAEEAEKGKRGKAPDAKKAVELVPAEKKVINIAPANGPAVRE